MVLEGAFMSIFFSTLYQGPKGTKHNYNNIPPLQLSTSLPIYPNTCMSCTSTQSTDPPYAFPASTRPDKVVDRG
jgi:hypothetical protein